MKREHIELNPSRTKIVATIGPASSDREVLRKMFLEGIDVCRLNFSHGAFETHREAIWTIRELNEELFTHTAILADLQGPKLRVGEMMAGGVLLVEGEFLEISGMPCLGTAKKVYLNYEGFARDVSPGQTVLIDDGKLKLEVVETNGADSVKARVIAGGMLKSRKGVNLPDTEISLPGLTEKDREDLAFALEHGVDWVALSFVRSAEDIRELRDLIDATKVDAGIIAKIEKPEAVALIDEIIAEADAIMVARGDLGVEAPFDEVPMMQKMIVRKCIEAAKPVIIATQMMESQITNFHPTRAEAADVANAVLDGADAVMLSGETSVGDYPVQVIQNMQKIIDSTEKFDELAGRQQKPIKGSDVFFTDSVCNSAAYLAGQSEAAAIVVLTERGHAAYMLSSCRSKTPVFVFTPNSRLIDRLALCRGVRAFGIDDSLSLAEKLSFTEAVLMESGNTRKGDVIIHVTAIHDKKNEYANSLRISSCG